MSTPIPDPRAALEAFLTATLGRPARVTALRQLTGGASRDTWSLDVEAADGERLALVLRRDLGGLIAPDALSRADEFRLLQLAHAAGVLVPQPRWESADPSVLGAPFFLVLLHQTHSGYEL